MSLSIFRNQALCLLPLAAALASLGAQAQSSADSAFTFSGFATIGLAGSNSGDGDYVVPGQVRGASKSWSGEVDSKLGLQLTGRVNPMFSGTVQVLTKQNGEGNFTPEVEWAFAKAQVLPSLALRAGRMGLPIFAVSDFRDVGYANTWLRPPIEVYGQVPVSHFDGADALYQTNIGSATLSAQLFGGASRAFFERSGLRLKNLGGLNVSAELDGGVTLRLGHAQGKLSVFNNTVSSLVTALQGYGFAGVADDLYAHGRDASFDGVGVAVDRGDWLANFEYTKRKTKSYVPDTTGWYATFGYRVAKFTPYVSFSQIKVDDTNVNNTVPSAYAALRAGVNQVIAGQYTEQKTTALGLRWDAYRNVAVKAQWDHIRPDGSGLFTATTANFGSPVNVYSLAVDLVF